MDETLISLRTPWVMALQEQWMKSIEIADHMGMAPRTVREWLDRGDIPYSGSRKPRTRLIDPYKTSLLERWQQGCHQGVQLERELRTKGYKGSPRAIYRYLETLDALSFSARKSGSPSTTKPLNPLLTLLAPQATWLFFRKLEDLKEEERENLRQLRQMSPHLETAYQLVEMFLHMVRERTGEQLDAWLAAVKASHLETFESFVTGVLQDKDAVFAGLTLPVEPHYPVTKHKTPLRTRTLGRLPIGGTDPGCFLGRPRLFGGTQRGGAI